jgi:hypothetical protein
VTGSQRKSIRWLQGSLETRPGEIKALFRQTLEPDRARELKEQMLAASLPV